MTDDSFLTDPAEQPPRFQLDVRDWLNSEEVARMTYEEQGIYIRLLCVSWMKVGIPKDPKTLARMLGITRAKFNKVWKTIGPCWEPAGDRLFQPRLERVRREFHYNEKTKKSRAKRAADARWDRERERKAQEQSQKDAA